MDSTSKSFHGLIERDPGCDAGPEARSADGADDRVPDAILNFARQLLAARRYRTRLLDGLSFGEPDWDILLDAFVAAGNKEALPVSSLCIVAHISVSTALRHINSMIICGYLRRSRDISDQRRSLIEITEAGEAKLRRCLRDIMGRINAAS